jgi:mannose-6-phosphate isomerase-like protein (cupin superfamily)
MQAFELAELAAQRQAAGRPYLEFLRVPALSAGVYELAAGAVDGQSPQTEDEVYFVTAGRARVSVGDDQRPVGPGSLIYVAAGVPHRFHNIPADLRLLVFFAPAEGSPAAGQP